MLRISLNEDWQFSRQGEERRQTVDLPHDAMLAEPRRGDCAGGTNTGWFAGADYVYIKTLDVPEKWADRTVWLEFEGVYHNARVFVNGVLAGERPYGYSGFLIPLDGLLRYGQENVIEVLAQNGDQPNSRWYSGAGLYRPVWLWLGPKEGYLPPDSLRVRTVSAFPPVIEVTAAPSGPGRVYVTILDGKRVLAGGEAKGGKPLTLSVPGAEPWSVDRPRLYTCRAEYGDDHRTEVQFGIRTVELSPIHGLLLNGRRVILRGACVNHDNGLLGAACWPDAEERKVRLLKQAGYNALRSAHNPCSRALLEACDRLGMLVLDELADCWYIHKTRYDYASYFPDWWRRDLEAMTAKDFNHPSVILYSLGNEVSETAQDRGIALTGEMTEYLHALDPTRPVTCGVNLFFNYLSTLGFGVYSDEKAEKEAQGKKSIGAGSQFFNSLAGLMGAEFMKAGAALPGSDAATRDAFARLDVAGYNYGINRYRKDLKKYPKRLILGSETFCSDAFRFWELAKTEPRLLGDFVWAGMDYLGEVGIGSWEYADYAPEFDHGPGWISAGSGRLDLTGYPLAESDYTRVAFQLEPGPILAVRPVNHPGQRHSPSAWKMTDAIRSWTWPGCEGNPAVVEVYTRAARAELFLNGESLGVKTRQEDQDCRLIFRTVYRPGTLSVVTWDTAGQEQRAELKTAGREVLLRVCPEEADARAGRLCYIALEYTDRAGERQPLARGTIRAEVTGGRLLALGNACPYNPLGYLTDTTGTYWGRAMAIVLADGSGPVIFTAGDGLRQAHVEIPLAGE